MDIVVPVGYKNILVVFKECLLRWKTMQSSTLTYAENAMHDLQSSRQFKRENLGVLKDDEFLCKEMISCYISSCESMLTSLRLSLETFESVVETLEALELDRKSENFHVLVCNEWVEDVKRMYRTELVNKKLCLAVMMEKKEKDDILKKWIEEPFIAEERINKIINLISV